MELEYDVFDLWLLPQYYRDEIHSAPESRRTSPAIMFVDVDVIIYSSVIDRHASSFSIAESLHGKHILIMLSQSRNAYLLLSE